MKLEIMWEVGDENVKVVVGTLVGEVLSGSIRCHTVEVSPGWMFTTITSGDDNPAEEEHTK